MKREICGPTEATRRESRLAKFSELISELKVALPSA